MSCAMPFQVATRWLSFVALLHECPNPSTLDDAMALLAQDLDVALRQGVHVQIGAETHVLRLGAVGVKGDWPFLIAAAHLERHFRRAPKRGESQMDCPGICHICMAGIPSMPFEDFRAQPSWMRSIGSAASLCPWHSAAPWHQLPSLRGCETYTFRPDLFSQLSPWSWTILRIVSPGGAGEFWRRWCGWSGCEIAGHDAEMAGILQSSQRCSDLVLLLQYLQSVWLRPWLGSWILMKPLRGLSVNCHDCISIYFDEERPYLSKLSKETLGCKTSLDWPEGGWQKGATTTLLMVPWLTFFKKLRCLFLRGPQLNSTAAIPRSGWRNGSPMIGQHPELQLIHECLSSRLLCLLALVCKKFSSVAVK